MQINAAFMGYFAEIVKGLIKATVKVINIPQNKPRLTQFPHIHVVFTRKHTRLYIAVVGMEYRIGGLDIKQALVQHPLLISKQGQHGLGRSVPVQLTDGGQRYAQCCEDFDKIRPLELVGRVMAVAVPTAPGRRKKANLVIIPERGFAQARAFREFLNRQQFRVGHHQPPFRAWLSKTVTPLSPGKKLPARQTNIKAALIKNSILLLREQSLVEPLPDRQGFSWP
jgi:hypothetical protein